MGPSRPDQLQTHCKSPILFTDKMSNGTNICNKNVRKKEARAKEKSKLSDRCVYVHKVKKDRMLLQYPYTELQNQQIWLPGNQHTLTVYCKREDNTLVLQAIEVLLAFNM